jgi:hypothetical protein
MRNAATASYKDKHSAYFASYLTLTTFCYIVYLLLLLTIRVSALALNLLLEDLDSAIISYKRICICVKLVVRGFRYFIFVL